MPVLVWFGIEPVNSDGLNINAKTCMCQNLPLKCQKADPEPFDQTFRGEIKLVYFNDGVWQ